MRDWDEVYREARGYKDGDTSAFWRCRRAITTLPLILPFAWGGLE
jgi:hypothetical protein